jgi:S-adenosylmethionine decarboxylase proenzyme
LKATGRHLLVEYQKCDREILNNQAMIEAMMQQAALAAGTTIVTSVFHPFFPQGISGVVVIEESHLSIHTWPEYGYAAVDFFTCGNGIPERAHEVLKNGLKSQKCEVMFVNRGELSGNAAMDVQSHVTETETGRTIHLSNLRQMERLGETAPLKVADIAK